MTTESKTRNPRSEGRQQRLPGIGFEREDWTAFRTVEGLQRRAGTDAANLVAVVVKELIDNALDGGGHCSVGIEGRMICVADTGPGIEGDDDRIARIFSMNRPQISTKYLRLPTRGALGNGIRVVVGAVAATGGRLFVTTRGRKLEIIPDLVTGMSSVVRVGEAPTVGTRIEVAINDRLAVGQYDLRMGQRAIMAAIDGGTSYGGKTSPWWYDVESFHELTLSVADESTTVRKFMTNFDGCSRLKIPPAFAGEPVCHLTRGDAEDLLEGAKSSAKPVNPSRLGGTNTAAFPGSYGKKTGARIEHVRGERSRVEIPHVVEAWVNITKARSSITCMVNSTPCIADVEATKYAGNFGTRISGAGLGLTLKTGTSAVSCVVNVITPHMPLTSDGKAPALGAFREPIEKALVMAWNRARAGRPTPEKTSVKAIVFQNMEEHIVAVSSGRKYRFNWRQVYYRIRPIVQEETGGELEWNYFSQTVVKEYLREHGDEPMAYRDSRGSFRSPHGEGSFPLGTLDVEKYDRPAYLYNKVLVVEKEGFFEVLQAEGWGERNDCALMTSKGQPTDAARDVIDMIGETEEPVTVFLLHDCDAAGTIIYQSFQEATEFKKARSLTIVNLGMDVEEALQLEAAGEIEIEDVTNGADRTVARYVPDEHKDWLQSHRVELNVFTTQRFIEWLDKKMEPYGRKLIPPLEHMAEYLRDNLEEEVRERITDRILAEAKIDDQVKAAMAGLSGKIDEMISTLPEDVEAELESDPQQRWSDPIRGIACELASQMEAMTTD